MELKKWNYKGFEIEESLKPGAKKFQYFFKIEEEGKKKCTFCIWMTDDIVSYLELKRRGFLLQRRTRSP